MMRHTRLAWVGLTISLWMLTGCSSDPTKGYAFNASYNKDIQSVSVPIFANPTFSRGLEAELTDAIVKEIQSSTPWRVTSPGDAQAVLSGTITDSRMRELSVNRTTGLAQELDVQLTVDFSFKDARTGKVLVARKSFTASEAFVPSNPVRERLETGQHAAVQRLAKDLVAELRSGW